jgi:hypothetical protein
MVTCPNQKKEQTAALARSIDTAGWHIAEDGVLAMMLDKYLVYSNSSSEAKSVFDGNKTMSLAPETSGWLLRRQAPDSR